MIHCAQLYLRFNILVMLPSFKECADNMVFMAVCNRWKDLCNGSKFMQENCEKTCEVCKPGNVSDVLANSIVFNINL